MSGPVVKCRVWPRMKTEFCAIRKFSFLLLSQDCLQARAQVRFPHRYRRTRRLRSDDTYHQASGDRGDPPKIKEMIKRRTTKREWETADVPGLSSNSGTSSSSTSLPQDSSSTSSSPATERSDDQAPGNWRDSTKIQNEKIKRGTTMEHRETDCETSRNGWRSSHKISKIRKCQQSDTLLLIQIRDVLRKWHPRSTVFTLTCLYSLPKSPLPEWLEDFIENLEDGGVLASRDTPARTSRDSQSEPPRKVFTLTSRKTEIAKSAGEPRSQGLLAGNALVIKCFAQKTLVTW